MRAITEISYPEFRERVPRYDQQARIAWKVVDVLYKHAVGNLKDLLVAGGDQIEVESRLDYVVRRSHERSVSIGEEVESYVLEKGFGTETARTLIRHHQEHPLQTPTVEDTRLL